MKPTQAQIEAADKAYDEAYEKYRGERGRTHGLALIAAITAAAEAGEPYKDGDALVTELIWEVDRAVKQAMRENGRYDTVIRHILNKHLTAAAEIEELHEHFFINGICSHCGIKVAEAFDPATIKRLAQLQEKMLSIHNEYHLSSNVTEAGEQAPSGEVGVCATHILHDKELIERCAQIVDRYKINIGEMAEIIAAEIRALKENLS